MCTLFSRREAMKNSLENKENKRKGRVCACGRKERKKRKKKKLLYNGSSEGIIIQMIILCLILDDCLTFDIR